MSPILVNFNQLTAKTFSLQNGQAPVDENKLLITYRNLTDRKYLLMCNLLDSIYYRNKENKKVAESNLVSLQEEEERTQNQILQAFPDFQFQKEPFEEEFNAIKIVLKKRNELLQYAIGEHKNSEYDSTWLLSYLRLTILGERDCFSNVSSSQNIQFIKLLVVSLDDPKLKELLRKYFNTMEDDYSGTSRRIFLFKRQADNITQELSQISGNLGIVPNRVIGIVEAREYVKAEYKNLGLPGIERFYPEIIFGSGVLKGHQSAYGLPSHSLYLPLDVLLSGRTSTLVHELTHSESYPYILAAVAAGKASKPDTLVPPDIFDRNLVIAKEIGLDKNEQAVHLGVRWVKLIDEAHKICYRLANSQDKYFNDSGADEAMQNKEILGKKYFLDLTTYLGCTEEIMARYAGYDADNDRPRLMLEKDLLKAKRTRNSDLFYETMIRIESIFVFQNLLKRELLPVKEEVDKIFYSYVDMADDFWKPVFDDEK